MNLPHQVNRVKEFAAILVRSGLADQQAVTSLLARYRNDYLPESKDPDTITAFCCFLVATGVLTPWQCDKLRRGQWKGFFYHDFVILDTLGFDGAVGHYLTRNINTGAYVDLTFRRTETGVECIVDHELWPAPKESS
jgi:hypothetical protein